LKTLSRGTGVLLLLGMAHSLNHSLFLVLPPLLGEVTRDLGASFQAIGAVATVSFFLYGAGALVGGPLSDRVGQVKIVSLSITLAGLSTVVFLLPRSLTVFSAGMYLTAVWASFYHPVANTLISKLYVENTAGAMGIHGAAASLGQMFTPTVAYLIGVHLHWSYAFAFFGLVSVATGLLLTRIPDSTPEASEFVSPLKVLTIPNLWVIVMFNIVLGLFQRGVELFFPAFISADRGFSGQLAAFANSVLLLFGVVGQLVGGRAADRYGSERVVIFASAGMVASMLLLLLLPSPTLSVILFIVIYGISLYGHQPAMTALQGRVSPPSLMGAAYGVMFFFAFGLGSVSAAVAGYIADSYSLSASFWIMTLFASIALAISLAIPRVMRRDDEG
jgi:FSR family fosmidomycin resistance protein-like MFS transporter